MKNEAWSTCNSFQESPPVRSHGIGRSQWPHYFVSGAKRIVFGTLPFLFNTWTSTMIGWCVWQRTCFNSSLAIPFLLIYYKNNVFKNKEGTAPVTDQNSESKYMNSTVCIFLHWGIGKCLQDGFSQPTSQTTAPTVFSFRLAKKPARLVPTLHRVSWNFNQMIPGKLLYCENTIIKFWIMFAGNNVETCQKVLENWTQITKCVISTHKLTNDKG